MAWFFKGIKDYSTGVVFEAKYSLNIHVDYWVHVFVRQVC